MTLSLIHLQYSEGFTFLIIVMVLQRMSAGVRKFRNVLRISRTVYEMASMLLRQEEVSEEVWIL